MLTTTSAFVDEGHCVSSCGKAPVVFASSQWASPTFTNSPFHVSNLWLSCLGKQNWFYYKSLASLVTQNWYHTSDVISSNCFYSASRARVTYILSLPGTVLGIFYCRLIFFSFYDEHRILFCCMSLFSFRWAWNSK